MVDIKNLQKRWFAISPRIDENESHQDVFNKYWTLLQMSYTKPHRFYHTLQHIEECLVYSDLIHDSLVSPNLFEIAIWFHDFIYQPKSKTNELDSNVSAMKFSKLINLRENDKNIIKSLILGTINHSNIDKKFADIYYMNDIDLSILGSNSERFWEYERQIRKEYEFAPLDLYQNVRGQIMNRFLSRDRIYTTSYFYDNFEEKARTNITSLLRSYLK